MTNKWQKKVAYFCDGLKELGLFLLSGPYFFEKYIDRGINHGCEKLLNTTCCRCLGEQENTVEMLAHEWFSLTPSLWTKSQILMYHNFPPCPIVSHSPDFNTITRFLKNLSEPFFKYLIVSNRIPPQLPFPIIKSK